MLRSSRPSLGARRRRPLRLLAAALASSVACLAAAPILASPASAATPAPVINLSIVTTTNTARFEFDVPLGGMVGVEVGNYPLNPNFTSYSQQYGNFVAGANGVPNKTHQIITVNGLKPHMVYLANIVFTKYGKVRNLPNKTAITKFKRRIELRVKDITVEGTSGGPATMQFRTALDENINDVPLIFGIYYHFPTTWKENNMFTQAFAFPGFQHATGDNVLSSQTIYDDEATTQLAVSIGGVQDDSFWGCSSSWGCGNAAFGKQIIDIGDHSTKAGPDYTKAWASPLVNEAGIRYFVSGTYTVHYTTSLAG